MSSVETIDRSSHKPDARPVTRPGIPSRHHHLAYSTHDTRATIEFYTRVMGMALVDAVIDDRIPSTNDAYTYLHTFFRMEDGACLAFFESPGVPQMPPIEHPAHWIFNDLALEVPNTGRRRQVVRLAYRQWSRGAAGRPRNHLQHLFF